MRQTADKKRKFKILAKLYYTFTQRHSFNSNIQFHCAIVVQYMTCNNRAWRGFCHFFTYLFRLKKICFTPDLIQ